MLNSSPWALLPPLFSTCTAAGLWAVYFAALYNEEILPLGTESRKGNGSRYYPFISVTGQFPPVSCYFSEILNLSAFVGFVIGLLRYVQLRDRLDKAWLNLLSVVLLSITCFGMTIVANFQVFTQWMIHCVGAEVGFVLAALFCWVESYITLRVDLNNEGKPVAIARFLLSASITLCMILKFSLSRFSLMHAAHCQWSVVMLFLVFIATFGIDFRHARFSLLCTDTDTRSLVHRSNKADNFPQTREHVSPL